MPTARVFGVTSRGDDQCTYALYSNVADWADFVRSIRNRCGRVRELTRRPRWAPAGAGRGRHWRWWRRQCHFRQRRWWERHWRVVAAGSPGTATPPTRTDSANGRSRWGLLARATAPAATSVTRPSSHATRHLRTSVQRLGDQFARLATTCSETLNVCTPSQARSKPHASPGSCAVSPGSTSAGSSSAFAALLALGALCLGRRRRNVA